MMRWSAQGELFLEAQLPVAVFSEVVPDGLSIPIGKLRPGLHRVTFVVCVPRWGALPVFAGRIKYGGGKVGSVFLGSELPAMDRHRLRRPGTVPDHQVTPDQVDEAAHLPVQTIDGPAAPADPLDLECGSMVLDFYDSVLTDSPTLVQTTLDLLRSTPAAPPPLPGPSERPRGAGKRRKSTASKQGKITIHTVPREVLRAKVAHLHSSVIASAGVWTTGASKSKHRSPRRNSGSTTTCGAAAGSPSAAITKAIATSSAAGVLPSTV